MPASPRTRLQHNPHQLKCTHGCKKWFKTAGGHTRHIRSFHNAEAAMHPWWRSHSHHSLIPDEAIQNFLMPLHRILNTPHAHCLMCLMVTYWCSMTHFLTTINLLTTIHLLTMIHQHAASLLCRIEQAFIIIHWLMVHNFLWTYVQVDDAAC